MYLATGSQVGIVIKITIAMQQVSSMLAFVILTLR